jgi:hypothetical protein
MERMAQWAVVIPAEQLAAQRLYHHETLALDDVAGPAPGDEVLVLDDERRAVALGRVATPDPLVVRYTRRAFDAPAPVALTVDRPATPVEPDAFAAAAALVAPAADNQTWLVSLDLPIEAPTPAEAVRLFWTYVRDLGPRELPAFVSPAGDELAMQAFVLGEEANQDPEEDD